MTHEAKSEPAELVSPAPSVAPVSAAGPLWQQLLLSQAIAQNSAGLSSLPNSEAFRQARIHCNFAAHIVRQPRFTHILPAAISISKLLSAVSSSGFTSAAVSVKIFCSQWLCKPSHRSQKCFCTSSAACCIS